MKQGRLVTELKPGKESLNMEVGCIRRLNLLQQILTEEIYSWFLNSRRRKNLNV